MDRAARPKMDRRCFNPDDRLTYHMQMDNNDDILARASNGERGAFDELVRTYQSYAYRLAVRILCNETEAEDVVQEAFVRVWRNFDRYDPRVLFTTWLYRIVTNLCLDHLRAMKRHGLVPHRHTSPVDASPDPPSAVDIEKAVSTADLIRIVRTIAGDLPETQRLVFTLRDLQDLSIAEVRQITGLSEASIKTNLHYARRTLRERMACEYDAKGKP
jgi:RNA polymerase sigma-70 factor (ECF subfamily)